MMSNYFAIHNGILHLSIDAARELGPIAEQRKVATITSILRSHDASLSRNDARSIAKVLVGDPGKMRYSVAK